MAATLAGCLGGETAVGVIGNLNKVHLYDNQITLAEEIVNTKQEYKGITVKLNIPNNIKHLKFEEFIQLVDVNMFEINNYKYVINKTVEMKEYK